MKDSQHLEARLRRAKSCLNDVATSIEQSKCIDLAPEIAMSFFFAGLIDKYEIIAAQYS
ncbi:MAG: hypothetical protein GWO07_06345, partial [Candidatus Dadabacteria bacterium]|nr:hypothetical protein [Candidatus Dadabacteria bacterium]NIS38183.1 hypothetical protein [Candidatus Saccharibacteria bacterium]NIT99584.1 hypothetical protein [Nitrosopumilaceae archaeon]NIV03644.1 hypothetical protein [Calditrichia bacterium]NIV71947.1 hypothetical protein [Calditrichia bacterium]